MDEGHLKVIVEAVQGFLAEHDDPNLRFILVGLPAG
jgi:Zn-dependent membrane protease YugP